MHDIASARSAQDFAPEFSRLLTTMERVANALERLAPPETAAVDLTAWPGYVWKGAEHRLLAVPEISHVPLVALVGIDSQKQEVMQNIRGFSTGIPANHMLLWGARGTGKSSLTKSVHASIHAETGGRLALVEVPRQEVESLSELLDILTVVDRRFLVFCDDLSFDDGDGAYKKLKTVLDGGIQGCPPNILLAVTSNRRHLLRRDMIENEQSTALHAGEGVEEKVSLADRFGLNLGFYSASQDDYLAMVLGHLGGLADAMDIDVITQEADNWARRRGSRSGRVAAQFARHVAVRQVHLGLDTTQESNACGKILPVIQVEPSYRGE